MKKNQEFRTKEEQSIRLEHTTDFYNYGSDIKDQWFERIFSYGNSRLGMSDEELMQEALFQEMMSATIGMQPELAALYFAIGIHELAQEGEKRGLMKEQTQDIKRTVLLELSQAESIDEMKKSSIRAALEINRRFKLFVKEHVSYSVRRAMEYIHIHRFENIKITEMAAELGCNRSWLSRCFHEETGKTIKEYIADVKMDAAERMLRSNVYRVQEIADILGYSNAQNFCRSYKRYYGKSPLEKDLTAVTAPSPSP